MQDLEFCGMRESLRCGMRDLVPQPGIEPRPAALGARSLNHWTTREMPLKFSLKYCSFSLPSLKTEGAKKWLVVYP